MKTHFSRHKCIQRWAWRKWKDSFWLFTFLDLICSFVNWLSQAPDIGSSKSSPALEQPWRLFFNLFLCSCVCHSGWFSVKISSKIQSPFVWQTPSSPHIWSHVVSKRKICPNWGHECILIEHHYSHTQNEVMWLGSSLERGLLWFHSVYIMPTGQFWCCPGPLGLRLLGIMVEMWVGWSRCHSHTYAMRSEWGALRFNEHKMDDRVLPWDLSFVIQLRGSKLTTEVPFKNAPACNISSQSCPSTVRLDQTTGNMLFLVQSHKGTTEDLSRGRWRPKKNDEEKSGSRRKWADLYTHVYSCGHFCKACCFKGKLIVFFCRELDKIM